MNPQTPQEQRLAVIDGKKYDFDALPAELKDLYMLSMEAMEKAMEGRRQSALYGLAHDTLIAQMKEKMNAPKSLDDGTETHTELPGDKPH